MKAIWTIDDNDPEAVAIKTRYLLEGVASENQWLMRKKSFKIPPLYQAGVRFRLEPWAADVQWFANCLEVLEMGWADCKMACAYRIAERREREPDRVFGFHLYWRTFDDDPLHASFGASRQKFDVYHVQIALPPDSPEGPIEDPSRFLHQ